MMERTDRHCRAFLRRITRSTLLYTEMITAEAVLHNRALLGFSPEEKPLALQLGGSDPGKLAQCARLAEEEGYDEVNLNVGCPSDRVKSGAFGACLMREPARVAAAVAAMRAACSLPVTVKHRIGVDELDRYEDMLAFVEEVAVAGCDRFAVHARIAWLEGLSPKENRSLPPLRYADVYRLKRERPELAIEINGGILSLAAAAEHLGHVDGVMIGRAAYDDPYLFARADQAFFRAPWPAPTRREVVLALLPYVAQWCARGLPLPRISRHLLGLFTGQRGARAWKRSLAEHAHLPGAGPEVLEAALSRVPAEVLDARPPYAASFFATSSKPR